MGVSSRWFRGSLLLVALLFAGLSACDDAVDYRAGDADPGGAVCGDGVCEEVEFYYSCSADCAPTGSVLERGVVDGKLTHFPDDLLTVADESTDTGRRVDFQGLLDEERSGMYFALRRALEQIEGIDGFGTSAGAFFRVPAVVDPESLKPIEESAEPGSPIVMGSFRDGTLTVVPVDVERFEGRPAGVVVRPEYPLEPGATGFLAITDGIQRVGGGTFMMDEELYRVLHDDVPEGYDVVAAELNEAADLLIAAGYVERRTEIVGLTTFTVQNPIVKTERIAEYIRQQDPEIVSRDGCETKTTWQQCTVSFRAFRYMDDELHIDDHEDGVPREEYTLKAEVFLPLDEGKYGGAPFPTLIFGHGLSGSRKDGDDLAEFFAPEGIALVVIDAPVHGDHPTASGSGDQIGIVFKLFGITTQPDLTIDSRTLRDGWRQSNYDKLALVEVLKAGLDADGDDAVDLDPQRLMYFGASLGAIQGPEFISMTDGMMANMLAVGGARVTDIVRKGTIFGPTLALLLDGLGSPFETSLFYLLTQTVVDGGDPASFAGHVLNDRLLGDEPVPLAAQMSVPDEVVSNPSNAYLIRNLTIPLIGRVAYPITFVDDVAGPLIDNHPSGVTAGALQTDWIWNEGLNAFEPATHSDGPASDEAIEYWKSFIESVLNGHAELIDPYPVFGRERPEQSSIDPKRTGLKSTPPAPPTLDAVRVPPPPFSSAR